MSYIGLALAIPIGLGCGILGAKANLSMWIPGSAAFVLGGLAQAVCSAAGLP